MTSPVTQALFEFTQRYTELWQQQTGHLPIADSDLDVSSPCISHGENNNFYWQAVPMASKLDFQSVEQGVEISLHPDIISFYGSQYAGDMQAKFEDNRLTLLQVWNEQDLLRLQENLIGHLITQRRYKLPPTLFIATLDDETKIFSLCNVSGKVMIEQLGSLQRYYLADSLTDFLQKLEPVLG